MNNHSHYSKPKIFHWRGSELTDFEKLLFMESHNKELIAMVRKYDIVILEMAKIIGGKEESERWKNKNFQVKSLEEKNIKLQSKIKRLLIENGDLKCKIEH